MNRREFTRGLILAAPMIFIPKIIPVRWIRPRYSFQFGDFMLEPAYKVVDLGKAGVWGFRGSEFWKIR